MKTPWQVHRTTAARMTVNDGGIMHTSSFCNGLWNTKQATALRHRISRRNPMEVALYARVSTTSSATAADD